MTSDRSSASDGSEVTSIIRHDVRKEDQAGYEEWLREIVPVASRFAGHRGVNVIRPVKGATEYTVILHFDTIDHLRGWLDSKERHELIEKALPKLTRADRVEIKTGLEFWFTPPSKPQLVRSYKQLLVTLSVILPLTIIIPPFLKLAFGRFSLWDVFLIRQFVTDLTMVALITYVIMPRYTRLIAKWLFK
jgi:uncharacterized protein